MQTDILSEDTHHPAMQAAGNAKGKKCKAAEDSGQEGWKEGVGSLHKVQQLAKKHTDNHWLPGLFSLVRPASSHEVRQLWQEVQGMIGGRRQGSRQSRGGEDQLAGDVAPLRTQTWRW